MNNAHNAEYVARCWAAERDAEEILVEIERCTALLGRTRDWQEIGNATYDHARVATLQQMFDEKIALKVGEQET